MRAKDFLNIMKKQCDRKNYSTHMVTTKTKVPYGGHCEYKNHMEYFCDSFDDCIRRVNLQFGYDIFDEENVRETVRYIDGKIERCIFVIECQYRPEKIRATVTFYANMLEISCVREELDEELPFN